MKQAFLISGFNMSQNASYDKYSALRQAIASKGYKVVPVPIFWNHTTVAQYCDKFVDFYNKNKAEENIVIGGSYGAMVTFLTAAELRPDRIFVCSLSPYFKEDKDKTTEQYRIKRFGKRRANAQQYLSAKETAAKINKANVPVVLMYGEKEKQILDGGLVRRVKETAKDLKNCKLVEIPDAPHQFRNSHYIEAIKQQL